MLTALAQLHLMSQAQHYVLEDAKERRRSNRELVSLFMNVQRALKPQVSLEIGAYEAGFSQNVRKLLPATAVFAFEANPHNFEQWRSTIDYQSLNIEYLNYAVADKRGEIEFHLQKTVAGATVEPGLRNNSIMMRRNADTTYETVLVPSISVGDFFNERGLRGKSATAWIDVEGAAKHVLSGMDAVLPQFTGILMEVEDRMYWEGQWHATDVIEFFTTRGFVPIARDFQFQFQYNVIFMPVTALANEDVLKVLEKHMSFLGRRGRKQPVTA